MFEDADRGFLRPTLAYLAMATALAGDRCRGRTRRTRRSRCEPEHLMASSASTSPAPRHGCTRRKATLHPPHSSLVVRAKVAADQQQPAFEAMALHDVARFAPLATVADRLEQLTEAVDGPLVRAMATHARGLADDDAGLLDEAARGFGAVNADLFGAEAGFAAARIHRRSGRRASAFAALEQARALAARCEGARTEGLRWADQPEDLTPREHEIAELAARNVSSREIAERLGISTRTVDNLLGRVYAKLGISSRQELRALRARGEW